MIVSVVVSPYTQMVIHIYKILCICYWKVWSLGQKGFSE